MRSISPWSALLALATQLLVACAPSALACPSDSSAALGKATQKVATRLVLCTMQQSASVFEPVELAIATDGIVANPFDPAQADFQVRYTSPSNKTIVVPAFAYQDFDPQTLVAKGSLNWRARFTPSEPGQWRAQAELAQPHLTSEPVLFQVAPNPKARGFVRISKQNTRYFAFDDGTFFFPIGLNLGWSGKSGQDALKDYERWLDKLSQNGGTIARVWMPAWSLGIEWKDTGLGDYSERMQQAWLLDQVFKQAEQRGVYIMLCLINHGQFSATTNPEWNDNPYNKANGGPLASPEAFVTDSQAKDLFKRRLRYIAARWGASPHLFAWEWWNEVNWTPIKDDQLKPWITEMTAYLQQYDPYDHLTSSSYSDGSSTRLWRMPEIDFAQQHDYSGQDPAKKLPSTFNNIGGIASRKPLLLAEFGYSADGPDQTGSDAIQFHNGLWAAPFSGFAGTGMYWWWDNLIDPQNLWGEFKGIATFMQDEDLPALAPAKASLSSFGATALALQSKQHALAWVHNGADDANEASMAYSKLRASGTIPSNWKYEPAMLKHVELTLSGLADGAYTARWFSPHTLEWQADQNVQVQSGKVVLSVPDFDRDLAVKLVATNAAH